MLALLPAGSLLGALSVESQLALVALPIALLGVMHGGLDPWVGEVVMRERLGRSGRTLFVVAYLAVMAIVIVSWILAPLATLAGFLLISVWHFGEQDAHGFAGRSDGLSIAVFGAVPVLGPVAAHPAEVALIFEWLTGVERIVLAEILNWLAQPLIAIWLVGTGMLVARLYIEADKDRRFQLAGLGVLVASMILLPPLIAFAAYFCLLHSFGHLLDMAARSRGPWRGMVAGPVGVAPVACHAGRACAGTVRLGCAFGYQYGRRDRPRSSRTGHLLRPGGIDRSTCTPLRGFPG